MHRHTSKSARRFRRSAERLILEHLDPRVLLNASTGFVDKTALADTWGPQSNFYGVPDPVFADPTSWNQADSSLDVYEQIDVWEEAVLSDYYNDLQQNGLMDVTDGAGYLDASDDDTWGDAAEGYGSSVLYVDFAGGMVASRAGDFWLGAEQINIPAYDLSMFGWGGREAESINYIMQFIQEDYAAYNITVTNAEPVSGEYNTLYVGGDNEWFRAGSSVIGVATYDVGNRDDSNYGFAFTEELGIYQQYSGGSLLKFSEYVANLITHEAGHNFGANHVDDATATMNPYLALTPVRTMFGRGDIPGTSTVQDTQSLMGVNLGYAGGTDDFGDNSANATNITLAAAFDGILERRDDVDAFAFTASTTGPVTIDLDSSIYGNLDSQLTVYNSNMTVVATNDDDGLTDDSYLTFDATMGQQYYLYVASAGGDSSGRYNLSFEAQAATPAPVVSVTDNVGLADDGQMDFGTMLVSGTASGTITISNTGTAELVISELSATGGYTLSQSSQAGLSGDDISIAAGTSVNVQVGLDPASTGSYAGVVTIASNDTNNERLTVALTTTVTTPQPEISFGGDLTAGTLDFGDILYGQSRTATLTISNDGDDTLTISNVNLTGPFTLISGFSGSPISVAPGQSQQVVLTTTPQSRGQLTGTVTIVSNDSDEGYASVPVAGQCVAGQLAVYEMAQTNNDGAIDFGALYVGETGSETVTLRNAGDADLTISAIEATGGFCMDIVCDANRAYDDITLAPGELLTVQVQYAPDAIGEAAGVLTIASDAVENAVQTVTLCGTAQAGGIEIVETDGNEDGQYSFGDVNTATGAQGQVYELTNCSGSTVTVNLDLADGGAFEIVGAEYFSIAPGATQTVTVAVVDAEASAMSDTLTMVTTGPGATTVQMALSADGYIALQSGKMGRFETHNGQSVMVLLSGSAQGRLRLGGAGEADIESIDFVGGGSGSLTIINSGSDIELGGLTGAVDLSLSAGNVTLVGALDIDGTMDGFSLGAISGDASVSFETDSGIMMRVGEISGNAVVDVDGDIRMLLADTLGGSSFSADDIGMMMLGAGLSSDLTITEGDLDTLMLRSGDLSGQIMVNGDIGTVFLLGGDLSGNVAATRDIGRILCLRGDITGEVSTRATLNSVMAQNVRSAQFSAGQAIERMTVFDDMIDSVISIGDDEAAAAYGNAVGSAAELGTLSVGGSFANSLVAVGVEADAAGDYLAGSAAGGHGQIGSVRLGRVVSDNNDVQFGLIARDEIDRVTVNNQTLASDYIDDDFCIKVLG